MGTGQTTLDFDGLSEETSRPVSTPAALMRLLHEEFARLNGQYFSGGMKEPSIVVSRRKSYGGYYRPRDHRIVISWQAYVEHGYAETLNTFRHEVAHITHMNHSKAFWALAEQLGCTKRHASSPIVQPRTPHKYVYACPTCDRKFLRNRRLVKASCGVCDKKYNPLHALKLVPKSRD